MFSRSFKYHRPRGLLTASFHDPGCMVQVGDEPNVRGAHRLAADGMAVTSQNTWPSLRFDVKAANRLAGRFLTAGFYYKTFMRPQLPVAGLRERAAAVRPRRRRCRRTPRTSVRQALRPPRRARRRRRPGRDGGGGRRRPGRARPCCWSRRSTQLGGHLRWGGEADLAALADLAGQVAAEPGIEVLTNSVVLGRYDDNWIAVLERRHGGADAERLIKARAKTLVVAPGLIERPYVFAGNDLPGVMLSTAVRRLINLYAVRPGERAVVLTANAEGDAAVADLKRAGVEVVRVDDARLGGDVTAGHGRTGVRAVEVADGTRIGCDLLVTAAGWTAPTSLLNMAGTARCTTRRRPGSSRTPPRLPEDVLATGGIAGDGSLEELTGHAAAVGAEAARRAARIAAARIAATPTRIGAGPGARPLRPAAQPRTPAPRPP